MAGANKALATGCRGSCLGFELCLGPTVSSSYPCPVRRNLAGIDVVARSLLLNRELAGREVLTDMQ